MSTATRDISLDGGRPLRLRGHDVTATVTPSIDETARRARIGLGAVSDPTLLRVLATMPVNEPLNWSSFTRNEQRTLRSAPDGVIERTDHRVTRLLVPPVKVESIFLRARDAARGLTAASQFAPLCRRAIVVDESTVSESVLLEAAYFGIGVYAVADDICHVLETPAPFAIRRWTWAQWQFHEQAFGQLLARL